MTFREELFNAWAPPGATWSDWAKPVLFAHAPERSQPRAHASALPLPTTLPSVFPPADGHTALILDLPGPAGVLLSPHLLQIGYRPVPLYNAAPGGTMPDGWPQIEAVPVRRILQALIDGAHTAAELGAKLPANAPPAFLLDAQRRVAQVALPPGAFDNRSLSLPTDFPSAPLLASRGITTVLLIHETTLEPREDLAHTLRRYRAAGLTLLILSLDSDQPPTPLTVAKPHRFGAIFQRALALLGFKRNPLGGFGGTLPEMSEGSGG